MKSAHLSILSALALVLLGAFPAAAQYDPPAGYYTPAQGLTGPALKAALHSIIRNHTVHSLHLELDRYLGCPQDPRPRPAQPGQRPPDLQQWQRAGVGHRR